jgi:opacity protein-like surface antigen
LCPPSITSVFGCLEQRNVNFNLYGWNATATENLNKWFGGDLDVGGAYNSLSPDFFFPSVPIVTKLHTVMYGPRFSYRKSERITPFVHVLVGVAHITGHNNQATVFTPLLALVPQGTSRTDTAFAWALGGGVDLKVSHRVAIRLIQADYVMTRFFDQRQDNGRLSAGIVIRFGGK